MIAYIVLSILCFLTGHPVLGIISIVGGVINIITELNDI